MRVDDGAVSGEKRCPAVPESRDFRKGGLCGGEGGSGALTVAEASAAFTWPCNKMIY